MDFPKVLEEFGLCMIQRLVSMQFPVHSMDFSHCHVCGLRLLEARMQGAPCASDRETWNRIAAAAAAGHACFKEVPEIGWIFVGCGWMLHGFSAGCLEKSCASLPIGHANQEKGSVGLIGDGWLDIWIMSDFGRHCRERMRAGYDMNEMAGRTMRDMQSLLV